MIIYTKPDCRFCEEAKRDLEERGVPYEEISIENNPKEEKEWMRLAGDNKIVPVLVTDGKVKIGFGGGERSKYGSVPYSKPLRRGVKH